MIVIFIYKKYSLIIDMSKTLANIFFICNLMIENNKIVIKITINKIHDKNI